MRHFYRCGRRLHYRPNICTQARKIDRIAYDEMLEMASMGAKVLQIRSVEFAKKYNVPVHVRSTFSDAPVQ